MTLYMLETRPLKGASVDAAFIQIVTSASALVNFPTLSDTAETKAHSALAE